ncbi:MAG: hypothetical protein K2Y40_06695 [Reyranella sp.]|nr:hypothetical protein [Reyranella sp.]
MVRDARRSQAEMQVDVAALRILVLGVVIVVRPGIVARSVAQHLQAPARGELAAGQGFGEGAEALGSHHPHQPQPFGRLHAGLAPTFEIDGAGAAGLGQALAIVAAHAPDALRRDRLLDRLELVREALLEGAADPLGPRPVEEVVAGKKSRARIAKHAAQRVRARQHAPAGRTQQVLELAGDRRTDGV